MTCPIPGLCSRSPTCRDRHCEGHPFPTRRIDMAACENKQEEGWSPVTSAVVVIAIAVLCVVAVIAAVYGR